MPNPTQQQPNTKRRSAGALRQRRVPRPWPEAREFRILSLDGGGIRGIFTASLLAEFEEQFLPTGKRIYEYFDLITGTSTGGIIALGLSLGLPARDMAALYAERGKEIFPPSSKSRLGRLLRQGRNAFRYQYEREGLRSVLKKTFKDHLYRDAKVPLCIPSCDGRYGEVYVFKTPHHPDFKKDGQEKMVKVALSTSAAPTYFKPLDDDGYYFLDGGLWANDPIMVGLTDALTSFDVDRGNVRILSISCGESPFTVKKKQMTGGLWAWRKVISAAMHLQSQNAQGQASLLIGADRVLRVVPNCPEIELDNYDEAIRLLPEEAERKAKLFGDTIRKVFLQNHH